MTRFSIVVGLCMLLGSCDNGSVASRFFEGSPQSEQARMREYSLEDQYSIFRYGNDVIHPPLLDLADPIAERGKDVVPFLLRRMEIDPDPDTSLRDTLLVFTRMQVLKYYSVKSDVTLMTDLQGRINAIRNLEARALLQSMLETIRKSQ